MNRTVPAAALLLASAMGVYGQSRTDQNVADTPPSARRTKKNSNYLRTALDLKETNLGPAFMGSDIASLARAIQRSPALKERSEFESTTAYDKRLSEFFDQRLYADVAPTSYVALVADPSENSSFEYDADSQVMSVVLKSSGGSMVDGLLVRKALLRSDTYIGSNAFGAKALIRKTHIEEYGVAFSLGSWMFSANHGDRRGLKYLIAMPPKEARGLKADGRLLVVCRLKAPWLRRFGQGHEPTITEPYETNIDSYYLQAVPEQLWIFNQRTGEVVRKISDSSTAQERDEQLTLLRRLTPVRLWAGATKTSVVGVAIDGAEATIEVLSAAGKTYSAKRKIVFTITEPGSPGDLLFVLNGQSYVPTWGKESKEIGRDESADSARAVITAP